MSTGKNYLYNLVVTVSNILFPLISFPYVSRVLNPDGVGQVQFAISFAQYFALIAALGIPIYGISKVSQIRNDRAKLDQFFSEVLILHMVTTVMLCIFYLIVIFQIPVFQQQVDTLIIGLLILASGVFSLDWFFHGLEKFRFIGFRTVVTKIIALLLLLILVREKGDVINYMIVMTVLIAGDYLLNIPFLKKNVSFRLKSLSLKRHIKPLTYIFFTMLAAAIYTRLDLVILGILNGNTEVGYYAASSRISKVAIPVITSYFAVIIPRASKSIINKDLKTESKLMQESFSFLAFLGTPICMGIILLRKEIIFIFSGQAFLPASESLLYLAFLPLFIGGGYILAYQGLVPRGLNKGLLLASLIGVVAFIILSLLLVPKYGHIGSGVTVLITETLVTMGYIIFIPKQLLKNVKWREFLYSIFICFGFYPIVLLIKNNIDSNFSITIVSIVTCSFYYLGLQKFIFKNQVIQMITKTLDSNEG